MAAEAVPIYTDTAAGLQLAAQDYVPSTKRWPKEASHRTDHTRSQINTVCPRAYRIYRRSPVPYICAHKHYVGYRTIAAAPTWLHFWLKCGPSRHVGQDSRTAHGCCSPRKAARRPALQLRVSGTSWPARRADSRTRIARLERRRAA